MKVLIIGSDSQLAEFKEKFTTPHEYEFSTGEQINRSLPEYDIIFDCYLGDNPEQFEMYAGLEETTVFVNAPKISLAELAYYQEEVACTLFGFNGLPGFINRSLLEVSCLNASDEPKLKAICGQLGTDFELVADRVGMVTPRIICMIINEAFYTLQEGTASREDIDMGMKLGTNYPFGPFEWSERIGLNHVYELLEAMYEDTKEERYKICSLLKQHYLRLK